MRSIRAFGQRLLLVLAVMLITVGGAQAGPVGKVLGEFGFGQEVQVAGDALATAAQAAAIGGDEVQPLGPSGTPKPLRSRGAEAARGISGALGDLALNSGELTCGLWLIQLRTHLRNLTMLVSRAIQVGDDEAEIARLSDLMQKTADFANKLEVACHRVGWLANEPADEWKATTRLHNLLPGGGTGGDAEAAGDPELPADEPAPEPLPEGWNEADVQCRHLCGDLFEAYANSLAHSRNKRAEAEALRRGELAEAQRRQARAQRNLEESQARRPPRPDHVRRDQRLLDEASAKVQEIQAQIDHLEALADALLARAQDQLQQLKDCVRRCRVDLRQSIGLDAGRIDSYFTEQIRLGGSNEDAVRYSNLPDPSRAAPKSGKSPAKTVRNVLKHSLIRRIGNDRDKDRKDEKDRERDREDDGHHPSEEDRDRHD